MTMIKVPLQFHRSAVESAVEIQRCCRSERISSISAVETRLPSPCARKEVNAEKQALMELMELAPQVTCGNGSSINGTATALPTGGPR